MTLDALSSPAPSRWRRLVRKLNGTFLITVAIPTLLALVYYGMVVSDAYISESRFVVRSPQRAAPTGLGALLASAGISRSHDDTYTVHGYVLSRDALAELDKALKVRENFSGQHIDLFSRFPGLGWDRSNEALYQYYIEHVVIAYDPVSSITTLKVRAFDAQTSQTINEMLLAMSERLVNNLNDRSRKDLIVVAEREVSEAEAKSLAASQALSKFRAKGGVFDPLRESAVQLDNVARLREELRVIDAQLSRLKQIAPSNPQIASLQQQRDELRRTIAAENDKVLGADSSLATKSSTYERLLLSKEIADKELASALSGLAAARNDAARKQLYLERLVQPNLPDTAVEPRRLRGILTVFIVGLLAWGVVSLLVAGVREHMD